jgi:competence protein ComEC
MLLGRREGRIRLQAGIGPALGLALLAGWLDRPRRLPELPESGTPAVLQGWMAAAPEAAAGLPAGWLRVESAVLPEWRTRDDEWRDRLVRVRGRQALLAYGERCRLLGSLRPPRPARNFFAYDERIALGSRAAVAVLNVDRVEPLSGGRGPAWRRELAEPLRARLTASVRATLAPPEAGLLAALTLGATDGIDTGLAEDWRALGISHILSISGMHVGVVAGALLACVGSPRRRRALVVLLAGISAYAVLGGLGAPVLRAALMAGWAALALHLHRPVRPLMALALASAGLVVQAPERHGDLGLQLSCLSTLGILVWARPLASIGRAAWLQGRRGRAAAWVLLNAGVGLAAQCATLPLVLWRFGYVSWLAPLANLVLVPLTNAALVLGLAALPLQLVSGVLARPIWLVAGALLHVGIRVSHWGAAACEPRLFVPTRGLDIGLAIAAAATALASGQVATRRRRTAAWLAVAAASAMLGLLLHSQRPIAPVWRLEALDVGQGDALVLTLGRDAWVIDAGDQRPVDQGSRTVVPHLRRQGIRRLRGLVLTHPHQDHCGGAHALLAALVVDTLYVGCVSSAAPEYAALHASAPDVPVRCLKAGDWLQLGPELQAQVLWPEETERLHSGPNGQSVVLWAQSRRFPALLAMGDLEADGEAELLAARAGDWRRAAADGLVLKCGHHGSRTSSSPAFLDAIDAEIAIVSVGASNRYGHPAAQTLAALDAKGCRVLRTDQGGAVRLELRGRTLWLERPGASPEPLQFDTAPAVRAQAGGER